MNISLEIHPEVLLYLSEIAHHNAICAEFPIAWHLRERLRSRAELRWVQAVARRESLSLNGDEIAQALEMKRPPARFKAQASTVRRLGELHRAARKIGSWSSPQHLGGETLEKFHDMLDPNSPTTGRYRMAPRKDFFLGGLPEVVPRAQIPKAVEGVFAWLSETPLGMTDVLGVAIAHQELMLLTPFLQFTPATVDALTTCLLSKRLLNRHGLAVVEQTFARDMDAYELALRDRSDGGRARWVRYFVIQLAAAMRAASSDVLKLRKHIQHEPWLDAAPLSAREELIYQRVLHARKTTSRQLLAALGQKASTLRMVQRDLARLAELGLIEKVGGRKDAHYRPLADLNRDEAPFPPLANQAISGREDAS